MSLRGRFSGLARTREALIPPLSRPSSNWLRRRLGREQGAGARTFEKLIVGLGNPGIQYARSRHNVGFLVLDLLAEKHHLSFSRRRFDALLAEGDLEGARVLLCKPQTFMNLSGKAVGKLSAFYRIPSRDIIVCYDDLDLPLGRIRLKPRGSAGGHHGMESIIAALGHSDFARLRVGIGRPTSKEDVSHVLGRFSEEEEQPARDALTRAAEAVEVWVREGIEKAMNEFNADR